MNKAFAFSIDDQKFIVTSLEDILPGMTGKIIDSDATFTVDHIDGFRIWAKWSNSNQSAWFTYQDIEEIFDFQNDQPNKSNIANTDLTYFENFKLAKEKAKASKIESQLKNFLVGLENRVTINDFGSVVLTEASGYDADFVNYLNETRGWNFRSVQGHNGWEHSMS